MKITKRENVKFNMSEEVLNIVNKFISDKFIEEQIDMEKSLSQYVENPSDTVTISSVDVLESYLCKDVLTETEADGLCELIEYYMVYDEKLLHQCFLNATLVIVECGMEICGTVSMNAVALKYIGKKVSELYALNKLK